MTRRSILDNKDKLTAAVKNSYCLYEVLQKMGLTGYSTNYAKLRQMIEKHQIDTSHFQANERRVKALKKSNSNKKILLSEILKGKHPDYQSHHLRRRLIEEGVFENVCNECGLLPSWNGRPLVLQLDHIDGNHNNHVKKNLRLLCPNCHTQTPTWGFRKNIGM